MLDPEYQLKKALEKSRLDAEMGLIPALQINDQNRVRQFTVKAGTSQSFSLQLFANSAAVGKQLFIASSDHPDNRLIQFGSQGVKLVQGQNKLEFTVDMPYRAKDSYQRTIEFAAAPR